MSLFRSDYQTQSQKFGWNIFNLFIEREFCEIFHCSHMGSEKSLGSLTVIYSESLYNQFFRTSRFSKADSWSEKKSCHLFLLYVGKETALVSDMVISKTLTNSLTSSRSLSKASYIGLSNSEQMILTWEHFGRFYLWNVHIWFEHTQIPMFKLGKYGPCENIREKNIIQNLAFKFTECLLIL